MIRKWLTIGIILLFIGIAYAPVMAQNTEKSQSASRGTWLYVGGSGPGNYTRIQDAIDNASDGDTVFVYDDSSPYFENVKVNISITLLGENRETTIIDANRSGCPVDLEANNITVSGFTLQNSGNIHWNDAGLHFKNYNSPDSHYNKIIGNKMINNYVGIFGYNSEKNYISDNLIINSQYCGIYFQAGCTSNVIQNNTILENAMGIEIQQTYHVQVIKNHIENNNVVGIVLFDDAQYNDVKYNTIIDNSIGIAIDGERAMAKYNDIFSNTIADNNEYGLYLFTAYCNKIHKNNFINNTIHASFDYRLGDKIIGLFFGKFQLNKFYRNYWDNLSSPQAYKIKGTIYRIKLSSPYFKEKIWYTYDWFPALKLYDIPGVS